MANQLHICTASRYNTKVDDENVGQQFSFNDVLYLTRETQNDVNQECLKTLTFASSTGGLGELGGLSSIQFSIFNLLWNIIFGFK